MKKNGFTLVELLAVIVVLAIVAGLAVISMSAIINNGKNGVYKNYESSLEGATRNYFIENIDEVPTTSKNIYLKDLINMNFIENFTDPNGGNCNDLDENSYVLVSRGSDTGSNINLTYKVCLICKNGETITYKSEDC